MKRLLSPATNLPGWMTLGFTLYAVIQAILNARAHHTAIGPAVIVAALAAGLAAYTRTQVTPVADPRVPGKLILTPETVLAALPPNPSIDQLAAWAHSLGYEVQLTTRQVTTPATDPATTTGTVGYPGPPVNPRMAYRGGTTTGPASPQPEAPEGGTTP